MKRKIVFLILFVFGLGLSSFCLADGASSSPTIILGNKKIENLISKDGTYKITFNDKAGGGITNIVSIGANFYSLNVPPEQILINGIPLSKFSENLFFMNALSNKLYLELKKIYDTANENENLKELDTKDKPDPSIEVVYAHVNAIQQVFRDIDITGINAIIQQFAAAQNKK